MIQTVFIKGIAQSDCPLALDRIKDLTAGKIQEGEGVFTRGRVQEIHPTGDFPRQLSDGQTFGLAFGQDFNHDFIFHELI